MKTNFNTSDLLFIIAIVACLVMVVSVALISFGHDFNNIALSAAGMIGVAVSIISVLVATVIDDIATERNRKNVNRK